MCESPSRSLLRSEVNSWSMNASSEKFTTKASSCGFEASTRSTALLFTAGRFRAMDPELSTTNAIETGKSVCWKLMMFCFTPSSKTWKLSFCRSCTRCPPESRTVAFSDTSSTSARSRNWLPSFSMGLFRGRGASPSGERTGSRSMVSAGACPDVACVGVFCAESESTAATNRNKKIAPAWSALLQWRIVARACMDSQRRQTLRWIQFHLYFTPLAVAVQVLGRVPDDILVAQLGGDLLGDIAHLAQVVDPEHAPARLFAKIVEQQRAGTLFGRGRIGVEDADRINLHIGLAHLRLDLALRVARPVVAAV